MTHSWDSDTGSCAPVDGGDRADVLQCRAAVVHFYKYCEQKQAGRSQPPPGTLIAVGEPRSEPNENMRTLTEVAARVQG